MSDPLSVAASIIGIIAAAGKVAETLGPFVSNVKDTKNIARTIQNQAKDSRSILQALQRLFDDLEQSPRRRRELIQIDQLRATLLDGAVIFSDLEPVVLQLGPAHESLRNRVQWVRKKDQLETFISRLELFKSSITVMLNILQCESDLDAITKRQELYDLTSQLLQSNRDLSLRLALLESHPRDESSSTLSQTGPRTSLSSIRSQIRAFEFERDLKESWVYRKARRSTTDVSFRSSIALSHAWSALSDISLSDISAISVVALPISSNDLSNGHYYRQNSATLLVRVTTEKTVIRSSLQISPAEEASEERLLAASALDSESEREREPSSSLSPHALTPDWPLLTDNSQIEQAEQVLKDTPPPLPPPGPETQEQSRVRSLSSIVNVDIPLPNGPSADLFHSSPFTEHLLTANRFSLESEDLDDPMPPPSAITEALQNEVYAALESVDDIWYDGDDEHPGPVTSTELSDTEALSDISLIVDPTVNKAEQASDLKQKRKKKKKNSLPIESDKVQYQTRRATPDGRLVVAWGSSLEPHPA